MGIEVLGPLTVDGLDGVGPRDRVVLEALVVRAGEFVAPDVLADALWGESVPASWPKVIQGCIARLRKRLGSTTIETSPHGYRLLGHDDLLDVRRFERLVDRARSCLADGDADRAAYLVEEALLLWRGDPLLEIRDWEPGRTEAERLDGLHRDAQELRVEALIAAGRSRGVLQDARALVAEAPYRESRWGLFARALYQSGRQSEALQVLHRARRMLRDDLGLEPGPQLVALQDQILRQDPSLATGPAPIAASEDCPWRGLLAYEPSDAEAFFGRDREVAEALRRLRERGVLVVVGASGTGKSSLVRAGVVAALQAEGTRVVLTSPGAHPDRSLDPTRGRGTPPVLVVDQAEEAVALCHDPEERAAYFAALGAYAGPIVMSLRADRMGDLSAYPEFADLVERGLFVLAAMSEDNLRQAVEGPARGAGLRLEPGLVDLLVRDVSGEPGALPLLSHALRQTWERREGPTLTVEGYRSTGGIRDAVARSAETLYERLAPAQREALRTLLLRLVMPSEDGEPVRTRVPRDRLGGDPGQEALVESLVAARLLSTDEGDLQIAHEALAREWPRLRGWLQDDMAGQRIFRHLASAAVAWDGMGRPDSELYRGVRLAAASEWADRAAPALTPVETAFLDASRQLGQREADHARSQLAQQRAANRRLRGALVGAAVLVVVSLVAGVVAVRAGDRSRADEARALRALRSSDAHRISLLASTGDDPDSNLLAAAEANRLEDSPTTRDALLQVLVSEPHLARISHVDLPFVDANVSPDGRTLAVATGDAENGVVLIDTATDRVLATYHHPAGRVRFVSADLIAVGMDLHDRKTPEDPLRLLDAHTLQEETVQLGDQGPPSVIRAGMELSPDHRYLAAGFEQLDASFQFSTITVRVWDLRHPARPVFAKPSDRFPAALALTDDRVVIGSDGKRELEEHDLRSARLLHRLVLPGVNGLDWHSSAVSPDGRLLAVTLDSDVALVSMSDLRVVRRWTNPSGPTSVPSFSRDGSRLLTYTRSDRAGFTVWDVATGHEVVTAGRFGSTDTVAVFGTDASTAYTASGLGLIRWQLDRDVSVLRQVPTPGLGRAVGYRFGSHDGRSIAYVDSGGARPHHFLLQIQDAADGSVRTAVQYPKVQGTNSGAWTLDDSALVLTQGSRLRVVRASDGRATMGPDYGVGHLVDVAPLSGDRVLVAAYDGRLVEADTRDLSRFRVLSRVPRTLLQFVLAGDGVHLLVEDSKLHLWQVDAGTGAARALAVGGVWGAALSPDGSRVAVVQEGGDLGLYDLRRRSWIARPTPFGGAGLWFSPDGRRFVSDQGDTVTLWNGMTAAREASVKVPDESGDVVAMFAPGRADVLLSGTTGSLHRWSTDPADWVADACRLAGRNLYHDEWKDLVGDRPYRRTCPEYPAPKT